MISAVRVGLWGDLNGKGSRAHRLMRFSLRHQQERL
jgi:hypothetical protein